MSELTGLLSLGSLTQSVQNGEIDTIVAGFTDLYGRFVGKRFEASYFTSEVAAKGTHACDYLLTVDMEMNPVPGYEFANWESGYGDVHLLPDLSTLRWARWLDRTALVICDVLDQREHLPVAQAPRNLLRQQLAGLEQLGFTAHAASELEYYIFRQSYRDLAANAFRDAPAAGWYIEDYQLLQGARVEDYHGEVRRYLGKSGVPVESTKGEWGLGQHELNIRYAGVLDMADRHIIQKQCMKEVADRMSLSVTFMAKYKESQAGSSCHMHLSLQRNGKNAFTGKESLGDVQCNDTFRHFLGGWIAHLPEMMVFYAPTVNSYKRYQAGSWAPTRLAWSRDNRTAGFRIVGSDESLRIECRVPGADCNPYLAYAAALASGLDGIANKIEPPSSYEGDAYHADDAPRVPQRLGDATELFRTSKFTRSAFGDQVVDHYAHFFRNELAAYEAAVSDWERQRYFERI